MEEGATTEELPLLYWSVGMSVAYFLDRYLMEEAHAAVGAAVPRQMGLCCIRRLGWTQASKQNLYMVSASSFCPEFLPCCPLMMAL